MTIEFDRLETLWKDGEQFNLYFNDEKLVKKLKITALKVTDEQGKEAKWVQSFWPNEQKKFILKVEQV